MATPAQIERIRQQRASLTNSANELSKIQVIPSNLIENAIPDNLKLKGQAALGKRVLDLGQKAISLVLPKLQTLSQELNLTGFTTDENSGLDINTLKQNYCPTPDRLTQLVETRNNIVGILTRLNSQFNTINQSLTGLNSATNALNTTINVISTVESALIVSTGLGLLPAPILGPAVSNLDLIQKSPELFPKSRSSNYHKSVVVKQVTIFYRFDHKKIYIVSVFDTRQNPKKIK